MHICLLCKIDLNEDTIVFMETKTISKEFDYQLELY